MPAKHKSLARAIAAKSPKHWPKHDSYHNRTLLGERLYDSQCLRCRVEKAAKKQLKESRDGR